MPRPPRLDAPGTLHHVIGRGIEGTKIFRNEGDKRDFLSRVAQLCPASFWMVYASARCLFCQLAVGRMGYPAAEVARFLGGTTSAVGRASPSESHPEIIKYL
jgi:hypothetical protein